MEQLKLILAKLLTMSPATKDGMISEVIPHLINDNINNMLTLTIVFNLNKDSSPGLDGFRGFLFQEY